MIVMGIDPGTAITGWGVLDDLKAKQTFVGGGVITTSPKQKQEERLVQIFDGVTYLLKKYRPEVLSLELLFFNTNVSTALLVGQARGVVMLAVQKLNVPIASYTPLQVKMAVTGYGRADKKQMQEMVKMALKLKEIPKPDDAADALAVALTYCFSHKRSEVK